MTEPRLDLLTGASPAEAWVELAAFLTAGFDRPFVASALAEEFRDGFVSVFRLDERLVGSQGFIPIRLDVGGRQVQAAKSERTLLAPEARGGGGFSRLYDAAVARAQDELGAELLIGLTAIPQVFEKVGYFTLSRVYWHSLVPVRTPVGALLSRGGRAGGGAGEPVPAVGLAWDDAAAGELDRFAELALVVASSGDALAVATVDGHGHARLRHMAARTRREAGAGLGALLRALRERGDVTRLRLSWNAASPTGRLLAGALRRAPYPYRRGGGHLIVRPLGVHDLRLLSHPESWDLFGWEDAIHEPAGTA